MSRCETERTRSAFLAIHAYYTRLAELADRAIRRNTPVPEVPALAELDVVDGWVVRNGQPVWSVREQAFAPAQLGWSGLSIAAARSAWRQATEYRLDATRELLDHTAKRLKHGNKSPESKARLSAEIGYYGALLEEHRRAIHGKAPLPQVPDATELEFVNGWLTWKGRPVWWSGQRPEGQPAAAPPASTAPAAQPAPRRPKFRHLMRRLRPRPA